MTEYYYESFTDPSNDEVTERMNELAEQFWRLRSHRELMKEESIPITVLVFEREKGLSHG